MSASGSPGKARACANSGVDAATGRVRIEVDPRYFRPTEVDLLVGDAAKAKAKIGWRPTTTLEDLIGEMMESDLAALAAGGRFAASAAE